MFVYVAVTRPFKDLGLNIVNISTELFIALSYSIVIFFYFDLSDEQENAVKWCVISFLICSLSVTIGYILFNFGLLIRSLVTHCRGRKDVAPEVKSTPIIEVYSLAPQDTPILEVYSLAPQNLDTKLEHEDEKLFHERSKMTQLNMTQDDSYAV